MADLSDVENAIVALISSLVYPNGTSQPSAVGLPVRIFRGWPVPATLDSDLAAGTANISIFSRGTGKNTTRFTTEFHDLPTPATTVSVVVNGNQITISGSGSANVTQYVTINIGGRIAVSYNVLATDTATTIAAALAALITNQFALATSIGPTITISPSPVLQAFVGVATNQLQESRRQTESMQITIWCPTPTTRDTIASTIEPTLSNTPFLTLADGFACRFRYSGTGVSDEKQTVQLYRRDLFYDAEYPTTVADSAFEVTAVQVNTRSGEESIPVTAATPTVTTIYPEPPQPSAGNPSFIAEQGNS